LAAQATASAAATVATAPAGFTAELAAAQPGEESVTWSFSAGGQAGRVRLRIDDGSASVSVTLANGWSCQGAVSQASGNSLVATCNDSGGHTVAVRLADLRRVDGGIAGELDVTAA
jgi:hypothetical protein